MLNKFADKALFFVIKDPLSRSAGSQEGVEVLLDPIRDDAQRACDEAKRISGQLPIHIVYVLAWTVGEGVKCVTECRRGEHIPNYAYYSMDVVKYFATTLLPYIADYLATEVRALTPLTPDEEIVARSI